MSDYLTLIKVIGIGIVVLAVLIILLSGYVKAAPNEAIIISGMHSKSRELIGRAGIKVPFFERKDRVTLELIQVDVKTSESVPTADFINISVDSVVNVQVGREKEFLDKAAKNFLNKPPKYIADVAKEVLEGNMREIVGQMPLQDMVKDRQKFAENVKSNAEPDLAAMGLKIISFNVQNFTDKEHVIENLGVDNVVAISKKAAITKADSEKEIKVAQAKADREANEARVEADQAIAEKQNQLEIKKADLKAEADKKKAAADASYKIEEQNQRKSIEVAEVEANTARATKEADLQKKNAEVREAALEAEVKKQADADLYQRQKMAEADKAERKAKAEADRYEQEQQADAMKKVAEANLYAKQQEAEGIATVGKAEAEAIQAKGEAEAIAMEKKAEAYKKYGQAAITEMIVNQLPGIAQAIASPMSRIEKITVIDTGNGQSGASQIAGYVPSALATVMESLKETTGFDLMKVLDANTIDAKVNKNITYTGDPIMQLNSGDVVMEREDDASGEVIAEPNDGKTEVDQDSQAENK